MTQPNPSTEVAPAKLRRSLSLPLLVLYGLGVTIGAGIYVLIGATAGKAGVYAPLSFVFAAIVMGFSAASFAELSGRFPVSAGEAAYVEGAFHSRLLSLATGGLVVFSGTVSSAAISIGGVGYLLEFFALPEAVLVALVVMLMGAIAAWGITQSVAFAGIFTIIEVAGLIAIIAGGFGSDFDLLRHVPEMVPSPGDAAVWVSVMSAGLLAFFAFIGFEDLVNLAEEVQRPERSLPWAIFLTLLGTSVIYILISFVAIFSGPIDELAASRAPLTLVFSRTTDFSPGTITLIAIVAILNGVIVQMIMASRVLYGLGRQGSLPALFTYVHPSTQTPLFATGCVVVAVLMLALVFPLEGLAETTSLVVLTTFALVNLALVKIKLSGVAPPPGTFVVSIWMPVAGLVSSVVFLSGSLLF